MNFRPGLRGFYAFTRAVGYTLAPFQRVIGRAVFGDEREVAAALPRGSAKSTLAALVALHHVLTVPDASVYIGAGSRDQARVIGRIIERFARHPAVAPHLTVRHDEIRLGDRHGPTVLAIVASDGGRALGWERPTLMIGDELVIWNDREPSLLTAMTTAMIKSPDAKLVLFSTAPLTADSPWGRIRARALALPDVRRNGAQIDARGDGLRWLEWSLPDDAEPSNLRAVKAANPAPWITLDMLREQRLRVSELDFLIFHANRSHVSSARWLPPGAWAACKQVYEIDPTAPLVLGVDIGGSRSSTAVIGCVARDDGRVDVATVEIWQGSDAVLKASAYIEQLVAAGRPIREIVYDPMRFESEALRLERDHGLVLVSWPQSEVRMTISSERLHALIIEQRLRHPGDRELDAHVAAAIAKPTPRGWRLVKSSDAAQIDAAIALSMAAERASEALPEIRFHGWLE